MTHKMTRRAALGVALGTLAAPALVQAQTMAGGVTRNVAAFRTYDWGDHYDALSGQAMLVADTQARSLHYWNAQGGDYRVYPTSVPRTDDLTKRGFTEIVRKKVGPDWTPTQSQVERFGWEYIPPGPDSPMGTHAMYLTWPTYAIHGTHDTRKIGRPSSDGCIGLYNEKIAELFELCPIGTKVRIL
ncbi:L,D-transpeptidase catalytic domain [Loktanella fryxellensis]|uniref:L,D-transpeptidase catalytic domain n=1 Tax=Loktanella fryxellensis TaxID=245187 RepID=A0A1H8G5T7_9RHOB|nr:L,D-transpeptidase [Loktanella fryxellensis]SEN39382.1 L,D-transpeptidase catalytic domain [Loktanella fryxellensis]